MKKIIQIAFIVCALLFFAFPILKFNRNGTISEKENRALAAKPILFKDKNFNEKIFSEYDAYFNDRFGGRNKLIVLNNAVNKLLHANSIIANKLALQGQNGWLYYLGDNNLNDFFKTNLLDQNELISFKGKTENAIKWCEANGIKYLFLICPNKHSVYPENYLFARPKGITRTDQIIKILKDLNVPYIFPRDYLISKKSEYTFPLYYETGTHWNQLAAMLTSQLLIEKMHSFFPNYMFPKIKYRIEKIEKSTYDSIQFMLNLPPALNTRIICAPTEKKYSDLYTYIKNEGIDGIITRASNPSLPRALIFRDSFFVALEPFVSPFFSETEYHWRQFCETDKEYILQYKPDIIIFEAVERYAPIILNPVF